MTTRIGRPKITRIIINSFGVMILLLSALEILPRISKAHPLI
jgi:hypothetical protein